MGRDASRWWCQVRQAQNLPASRCGLGGMSWGWPWPSVIGRPPVVAKLGVAFDTKPAPNTNERGQQCGWRFRGSAGPDTGPFSFILSFQVHRFRLTVMPRQRLWTCRERRFSRLGTTLHAYPPNAGPLSSTGSPAVIQGHFIGWSFS